MPSALLAGSFDPPTLGHLDIIRRAASSYDVLYVGISENVQKRIPLFSVKEKKAMLAKICTPFTQVRIVSFTGLVVDYVKKQKIDCLVRGVRSFADFEFEMQMAAANRIMIGVETFLLPANPCYGHLSSTLIREIGSFGHRLHDFVPPEIEAEVFQRLSSD